MEHLPIALTVSGRPVLLAGDGAGALNRARLLARTDAHMRLVSRAPTPELRDFADAAGFSVARRAVLPSDLDDCAAVFIAVDDEDTAAALAADAQARGIPVNVIDRPELSSFIMPAIVDRDPLVVAVSSGGTSPILAQRLRGRIERMLPNRLGRLAHFADGFRDAIRRRWPDLPTRRRIWNEVFDGPIGQAFLKGDEAQARAAMIRLINRPSSDAGQAGVVHLVGAGPGDPDLLTLKALRLLERADVVVHDRLVGPGILDLARRDALRVAVGKAKGAHSVGQEAINALLLHHAREGRIVVRLKGGDPFIFGRGGEEAAYLRAQGVAVSIVPGITAAAGCAAAAGIPLTHRDLASSVSFVTGHDAHDDAEPDWSALASGRDTLVVYMGLSSAGTVASRLVAGGRDPATPVAIVSDGTLPTQRTLRTTLAGLDRTVSEQDVRSPALLIVGAVAAMAVCEPAAMRVAAAE
ncbi:MAG: siroheme synthase CysG [Alphaproteobacteria bacterium]